MFKAKPSASNVSQQVRDRIYGFARAASSSRRYNRSIQMLIEVRMTERRVAQVNSTNSDALERKHALSRIFCWVSCIARCRWSLKQSKAGTNHGQSRTWRNGRAPHSSSELRSVPTSTSSVSSNAIFSARCAFRTPLVCFQTNVGGLAVVLLFNGAQRLRGVSFAPRGVTRSLTACGPLRRSGSYRPAKNCGAWFVMGAYGTDGFGPAPRHHDDPHVCMRPEAQSRRALT